MTSYPFLSFFFSAPQPLGRDGRRGGLEAAAAEVHGPRGGAEGGEGAVAGLPSGGAAGAGGLQGLSKVIELNRDEM